MKSKRLIIVCLIIILIVAVASFISINFIFPKETNLEVLSDSSLYSDDNFTVRLTENGKPIADQSIFITFKDSDGNLNIVSSKTNDDGLAKASLNNLEVGNYIVEIDYSGNDEYKSSNASTILEIKNKDTLENTETVYKSSSDNSDSDYDPTRDDSHQYASEEDPVTVQQEDGLYTYYGPGHYDYYAGDNHMSGEYYKYKNQYGNSY